MLHVTDTVIRVQSPYDADFIRRAKQIGGKWNGTTRVWEFLATNLPLVRTLHTEVYGYDGDPHAHKVTMRINLDGMSLGADLVIADVVALHKFDRDSAPRCGEGVTVVAGELLSHGGSRNSPKITFTPGTVVEVPGIPLSVAQGLTTDRPDRFQIVENDTLIPAIPVAPIAAIDLAALAEQWNQPDAFPMLVDLVRQVNEKWGLDLEIEIETGRLYRR